MAVSELLDPVLHVVEDPLDLVLVVHGEVMVVPVVECTNCSAVLDLSTLRRQSYTFLLICCHPPAATPEVR